MFISNDAFYCVNEKISQIHPKTVAFNQVKAKPTIFVKQKYLTVYMTFDLHL